MTDLSQPGVTSPIERARLSAELLQIRISLEGKALSPMEKVRASGRGLEVRALLGQPAVIDAENKNGATGLRVGPLSGGAADGMPDNLQPVQGPGAVAGTVAEGAPIITPQATPDSQEDPQLPLYARRDFYHGTALPFASFAQGERKGSGYDHQGKGFYLTTDKQGYARFFAMQAADKILNGPTPPEGEQAQVLEAGGVILDVQLTADAKIIDLASKDAPPELVAMVGDVTNGGALRDQVLALGYDGIAFVELNAPEGVPVKNGAVTVVLYSTEKASIPGHEAAGTVPALGLDEMGAGKDPGSARDSSVQVVEEAGLSIRLPLISEELVADYNRATHLGKGRDINAELAASVRLLLEDLARKKHTLDTPEQKAEAVLLVEQYARRLAGDTRQDLAAGARNPSWFVTGRSGRNMEKASRASQKQSDKSLEAYRRLEEFRGSIAKSLYAMRPAEVKQAQAVQANLRTVAEYVGMFVGYVQNRQVTLATEARKWASPKALKLIDQAYQADPAGTRETLRSMNALVTEHGGLTALFGARSGAGKRIAELLAQADTPEPGPASAPAAPLDITKDTTDADIDTAGDDQLKNKLLAVAKDFFRGLTPARKDVARRLQQGVYDRLEVIQALKQHRDYLVERALAAAEADAERTTTMDRLYGDKSVEELEALYEAMGGDIRSMQSAREFSDGGRRTGPAVANESARQMGEHRLQLAIYLKDRRERESEVKIDVTDAAGQPAVAASAHQIIEYTTKGKGKVLRGIIRMDLTLAEAKAIDPYTWRMNGGYFIREKYLSGDTSAVQAAPAPVALTPEQEAEKQERDARVALERQQEALANQVGKLRAAGEKAIASGSDGMSADRKTNTARRAGMAASAYARAAADEADGRTLNSIADAIEVGAGGALASLNSRAQLQELKSAISRAKFESERGLSYRDQVARQGEPVGPELLVHVTMPPRLVWSSRYKSAAMTLAKKAPTGNSKLIAALNKLGQRTERWPLVNEGDIAITRKAYKVLGSVKEAWDLKDPIEMLGRIERLNRMGITNDAQLQDACRALLPHLAAKKEESAVVKAERAVIGQKVGIDFFPTPAAVAQRMARLARISKDMRVLEPSAGNGNLADAAAAAGGVVDVVEISSQLRDILTAKGYTAVAHDFITFKPDEPYRAILMNPPFSKRQDAEHIMHAYSMLASGGTLVAIAGEGVFFGQDKKAEQFRTWLDAHNAEVEKLEGGTFNDNALLAQTSANARLIVLRK